MMPAQVRFLLEGLAREIVSDHEACLASAADAVSHAISAGRKLIEVKASLDHGEFTPWIIENCPFSIRAAQNYMRVAKTHDPAFLDSRPQSITQALRQLTDESPGDEEQPLFFGFDHDEGGSKPVDLGPAWIGLPAGEFKSEEDDTMSPRDPLPGQGSLFEEPPSSGPIEEPWSDSENERKQKVESGETVTANIKTDSRLIAWAQATGRYVRIDRTTPWGNPFLLGEDGNRDEVLQAYRYYLEWKRGLNKRLDDLRGKVLGCWCYPDRCHGDVLIWKQRMLGPDLVPCAAWHPAGGEAERVGCHQ